MRSARERRANQAVNAIFGGGLPANYNPNAATGMWAGFATVLMLIALFWMAVSL